MADGFGEGSGKATSTTLGLSTTAVQPGVSYDGQNAQVQQQPSLQSIVAMAGAKRGANWFYWIAGLSLVNTAPWQSAAVNSILCSGLA